MWRSKTTVPRLPHDHVPRPALLDALDRGEGRALTLVSAPPGYGKTLVLAEWVHRGGPACAWVTLDEHDDDPRHFWTSVLAALSTCPAVPATGRVNGLVVPRTSVGVDFVLELLDALADLDGPVRLVLDDAHHLRSPEVVHGLHLLLRHRPAGLRLVLASRLDPALPVARLRMEQQLCEVRSAQLGFSLDETATLARACGLRLTCAQTAVLHDRTDGWVAGIRLAAMPLRDAPDPDRFLADLSGDDRPVADYLAGEVLAHLSAAELDLLRRTSVSDRLPGALAAELSGRPDAADVLGALERTTGLVVSTGEHRTEFRVQELTRSYLAADLSRQGPGLADELHGRAASWWAGQGQPLLALRHAAEAADPALMAALLRRWAPTLVARGDHAELAGAVATLDGTGAADAWLPVVSAQLAVAAGDVRTAREHLRRAAQVAAEHPDDADLASFRATTEWLAGWTGDLSLPATPVTDPALAALVSAGRGAARILSRAPSAVVLGDLESALAVARDQHLGFLEVQSLTLIGTAAWVAGDSGRAAGAAAAAVSAAAAHGWQESWWTGTAYSALAAACLLRAAPQHALRAADEGLRIDTVHTDPGIRFSLRCSRGGALFDLGRRTAGLAELQEARAEVGRTRLALPQVAAGALLEHRAALLLGSAAAAATSAGRLDAEGAGTAEHALTRAWTMAAAGSAGPARAAVAPVLDGSLLQILPTTVVEAWLVEVWGALRSGDRPTARRGLQTALAHAEPLDLLRPFALAGQGVRALLVDQLGGSRDPAAFAFRCLSARQRVLRAPGPGLSDRELDVLTHLVGLGNLGEIAEDMAVSVNTIKSHVRAIYGKLGVNTRRTAVLTALEQGLLS
ncbi:LuxR C-terminal-related transcriptional regulator [Blastococcus sp. URHD0036]|uniref:helix-turn-helix transcriptional regulator n=1 Tax=Blastococcus sp. URHD0036 TaxID=1380356 RepID=UPI0004956B97|nr:LuxR C-terminal-related transcriptional regulator [Blastococcus sp. URHD0036]